MKVTGETVTNLPDRFQNLLERSAQLHHHLCPRQVLGVRMGLLGGSLLELEVPQTGKRLLTIAETDGCTTDGLAVSTGCWVGRRSLRVLDFGKVAATFVDTESGRAVRLAPSPDSRRLATTFAPDTATRWEAYLIGYQRVPDEQLFSVAWVQLTQSLEQILSREGHRVACHHCGEEIFNEREVRQDGLILCRACAGARYYTVLTSGPTSAAQLLPVVDRYVL